jgi:hypothetical protein
VTTLLLAPVTTDADREVRHQLRRQIARLEADLPPGAGRRGSHGARLLSVEELERVRDDLVRRIQEGRFTQGEEQERKRRLREEMLLNPGRHRGRAVSNAEVGEPGCTRWQCWFRLTVSGGCP